MSDQYIPGDGCECGAWNESECGCGVDWTPKRQKELEAEVAKLRKKIKRIQDQLHAAMWIIEKQEQKERLEMASPPLTPNDHELPKH